MVRRPQGRATDAWRFKSDAMSLVQPVLLEVAAGVLREGGPWCGPSEERWLGQLLHGAPPPRDPPPGLSGLVAHG